MKWRRCRASCHSNPQSSPTFLPSLTSLRLSWSMAKASQLLNTTVGGLHVKSWWNLIEWRSYCALHHSGIYAKKPKNKSRSKYHNASDICCKSWSFCLQFHIHEAWCVSTFFFLMISGNMNLWAGFENASAQQIIQQVKCLHFYFYFIICPVKLV